MTNEEIKTLEALTTKELQEKLSAMDFEGAEALTTKGQIISVIKALSKKEKQSNKAIDENTPMINDNVKEDSEHHAGKAAKMKAYLEEQPRIHYAIPLGIGEKKGAYETVTINGYRLSILKGVVVSLPKPVVDVLMQSYTDTQNAGADMLLDRNETRDGMPIADRLS